MTLTYIGSQTLGAALPVAAAATASASASLSAQLPSLTAQVTALLEVQPPVVTASLITNVAALTTALTTLVSLGVAVIPPSVNIEAAASLNASLGALQAAVDLQTSLLAQFATPGIFVYAYDGPSGEMGGAVTSALSAGLPGSGDPAQNIKALVLACSDPAASAALFAVAGVS